MTGYEQFVQQKFKSPEATLTDIQKLSDLDAAFIHAGLGIFGEVSELITAPNRTNQKEELGDSIFFLIAALQNRGLVPHNKDFYEQFVGEHQDGQQAMRNLFRASADLFDLCKKRLVYAKGLPTDLTIPTMLFEIDKSLYQVCVFLGFDWDDVINDNIRKLSQRYKSGFSNAEAQQRADKYDFHRDGPISESRIAD